MYYVFRKVKNMNSKVKALLEKFSNDEIFKRREEISLYTLSREFGVSIRSIRNYVEDANLFLEKSGLKPLVIIENGVIANANNPLFISRVLEDFNLYNYRLSKSERKKIISLIILLSEDYITTFEIADLLYFSRITVINDINELKKELFHAKLKIHSKHGRGIRVQGDEAIRRLLCVRLISEKFNKAQLDEILRKRFENYYNLAFTEKLFKKILSDIQLRHDMYFSEENIDFLVSYFYVILLRRNKSDASLSQKQVVDERYVEFAADLLKYISTFFNIRYSRFEHEVSFLSHLLSERGYVSHLSNMNIVEVQMITAKFISEISIGLKNNLESDFEFYQYLSNHIISIMKKNVYEMDDDISDIYENIILNNKKVVEVIKENKYIFENYFNRSLTEVELDYIVIHVLAAIERNNLKQINLRVILLCNLGVGSSQLLKARIDKHFKFERLDIVLFDDFIEKNFDLSEVDFIISTMHLDKFQDLCDNVKISLFLNDKDVVIIENKINEICSKKDSNMTLFRKEEFADAHMDLLTQLRTTLDLTFGSGSAKKMLEQIAHNLLSKMEQSEAMDEKMIQCEIVQAIKEFESRNTQAPKDDQPPLSEILSEKFVKVDIEVKGVEEAIEKCGEILLDAGYITGEYIEAVLENMRQYGNYSILGEKFILPHADLGMGSRKVGMALIRLKNEVEFELPRVEDEVIDERFKKVKYVCMLSVVDRHSHLKALFTLTNLIHHPHFMKLLHGAKDGVQISRLIKKFERFEV